MQNSKHNPASFRSLLTFSKSNPRFAITQIVFVIITGVLFGCKESGPVDRTGSATSKDKSVVDSVRDIGLTLPVLNALFFEEGFESELRSKLELTDAQVGKLKAAASASVADLSEEATDYLGSARSAKKRSEEQIENIIGREKAGQLLRLVAARYSSGDIDGLFPTRPNSIPADTRIVVNAPAFRMDVFEEGKLIKSYKIGIGYPEFPLPTGMRRAEQIIFNPTWTPPDEPWVKGKVQAGKKVPAGSKLNPLGPIKIPIGLPSLIHGGKAVSKLGNFASHGCVGLTNEQVQDFSALLTALSGIPLSNDSILSLEKNKTKTKTLKLTRAIPVELRYETIVVENGAVHIYRDIYERGTNTMENAGRVLSVYNIKPEQLSNEERTALAAALEEMNKDAQGNTIAADATGKGAGVPSGSKQENTQGKSKGIQNGSVTKTVAGSKELIVPVGILQGKGYPAVVNFNQGK